VRKIGDVNGVDVFWGINVPPSSIIVFVLLKLSSFGHGIESRRVLLSPVTASLCAARRTQSAKHADDGGGIFG
jgi:hypothetical protein